MSKDERLEQRPSWSTEFLGGAATFLTLSYILVLNPVLLAQTGIDISAAFFATAVSAAATTLIMGLWAKLPFALAPAPSLTTFFVSYVCLTLGLPWQTGMAAVVVSGVLSIAMAELAVRQRLIGVMPVGLKYSILFVLFGFLAANGLRQAQLIGHERELITLGRAFTDDAVLGANVAIMLTGFSIAVVLQLRPINFRGSAIVAIFAATIVAASLGIRSDTRAEFSPAMFSSVGQADFSALLDWRVLSPLLVLFVIDFFGGVGKFVGLFAAMGQSGVSDSDPRMSRALRVDGIGNVIGGFLGASSIAVFVSSAAGVSAGARTGRAAIVVSALMLGSLVLIPIVGAIPVQATSGVLIFVACILIPWKDMLGTGFSRVLNLDRSDTIAFMVGASVAFLTFNIEVALAAVFIWYAIKLVVRHGASKEHLLFHGTTVVLVAAVASQWLWSAS